MLQFVDGCSLLHFFCMNFPHPSNSIPRRRAAQSSVSDQVRTPGHLDWTGPPPPRPLSGLRLTQRRGWGAGGASQPGRPPSPAPPAPSAPAGRGDGRGRTWSKVLRRRQGTQARRLRPNSSGREAGGTSAEPPSRGPPLAFPRAPPPSAIFWRLSALALRLSLWKPGGCDNPPPGGLKLKSGEMPKVPGRARTPPEAPRTRCIPPPPPKVPKSVHRVQRGCHRE